MAEHEQLLVAQVPEHRHVDSCRGEHRPDLMLPELLS